MTEDCAFLTLPDRRLAYQQQRGRGGKVPLLFLGGYGSDMDGTKAAFLAQRCAEVERDFTRFDYRGHGRSSGAFVDCTLGDWFADALTVFDQLTEGPQLLVGSSMGGWIALLLARARPERVAGFVGIAAAPDFTEDLVRPSLTPKQREELARDGLTYDENAPADFRLPMTQRLLDEARDHLVLRTPLRFNAPVHLLQGQRDAEVPWRHALRLMEHLDAPSGRLTLIKDGDHRLSRAQDLALLWDTVRLGWG